MIRPQVLIAMMLLCASCFRMESKQMATAMGQSNSFKRCLKSGGVDPDQFISCVGTTDARSELDGCIPNGKHHEVMQCMDQQAGDEPPTSR